MNSKEEHQLVMRIPQNDMSLMQDLYRLYADYVFTIALSITKQEEALAAEITQDTFVKVWKNIQNYDDSRAALRTWIARIARNTAIDRLRGLSRQPIVVDWEQVAECLMTNNTPETQALFNENAQKIRECLKQLPNHQRTALVLSYYSGMTQAEIAQTLDEPLGTIKSRIRLGLQQLKQLLIQQNGLSHYAE